MAGKPGSGKGRRGNREGVYLSDAVSERFSDFYKARPYYPSKSRIFETALDWYMQMAEQFGVDERWYPKIPTPQGVKKGGAAAGSRG